MGSRDPQLHDLPIPTLCINHLTSNIDWQNIATMAALAPSAFSTSTSSFRTSQSRHAPYSYADSSLTQLPAVEIPFDELRRRMAEFTSKFDAFIERGRKRVLEERNDFKARLSELNGTSPASSCNAQAYSHIQIKSTLQRHRSIAFSLHSAHIVT